MGRARDISLEGIFVELKLTDPTRPLAIGDMLHLRFSLPNIEGSIETKAIAARFEKSPRGEVTGVGFEFFQLSSRELTAVQEYVDMSLSGLDFEDS